MFFRTPFGANGDLTAIPNDEQVDGSVSMEEGYGFDYSRDPETDPLAKDVERDRQNWLFNEITKALQQYQTYGFPEFIEASDNGGSPYSYSKLAYVRYDDGAGYAIYYSLVDSNTSNPTDATKWSRVGGSTSAFLTGMGIEWHGATLPSTWVWQNGQTIGNASSGATGRANADTADLFGLLWTAYPNSTLPIEDSSGAASTRGASAAADFAANKRLPTPDKRGRTAVGKDDMGGASAAGRMTSGGSGIAGTTMGASGGDQTVALTSSQNGSHTHSFSGTTSSAGAHDHTISVGVSSGPGNAASGPSNSPGATVTTSTAGAHTHTVSGSTGSSGSGSAHQNTQPSIVCNFIIKL